MPVPGLEEMQMNGLRAEGFGGVGEGGDGQGEECATHTRAPATLAAAERAEHHTPTPH
jgi:hypothetical protein